MTSLKYVFDLDHTLYPDPADKLERYKKAAARAAVHLGAPLSLGEAEELAAASFKENGSELTVFMERYNIEYGPLTKAYHHFAVEEFADGIRLDPALKDVFNAIAADDKVVLTHSTSEWAWPILEKLGMTETLHQSHVLTQDHPDIEYARKDRSEKPFRAAMALLGSVPGDTAMFDDVAANLEIPHRLGMRTVLVHWGKSAAELPAHVHQQTENVASFFQRLKP